MPLGIPPLLRVRKLLSTDTRDTLRTFAEASLDFRNKMKTSITSDKILTTLAQRMLILCKGPKNKVGGNLSEHNILWSRYPMTLGQQCNLHGLCLPCEVGDSPTPSVLLGR